MGAKEIRELKKKAREPKSKSYGIRKRSDKAKEREADDAALLKSDDEFYKSIWAAREHICYECGVGLGVKMKKWFMHHLLEKEDYDEFRHDARNIALLCLLHHDQVRMDISKVPRVQALTIATRKLLLNEE
jgi:hypothetical protein